MQARRASDRGQSIAEFAFVLPVLLLFALGAADYGRVYYHDIQVRNAARNGSAFGAGSTSNSTNHQGIHDAALDGVSLPAAATITDTLAADSSGGHALSVKVDAPFDMLVAWPFLPHHVLLSHTVEAKVLE